MVTAFGRLEKEDYRFEASPVCMVRPYLKIKTAKTNTKALRIKGVAQLAECLVSVCKLDSNTT